MLFFKKSLEFIKSIIHWIKRLKKLQEIYYVSLCNNFHTL